MIFEEKGDYLIFAYYEPDTGFLFSEQCLYTKKLSDISPNEFKTLEFLSQSYLQKLKLDSLKNSNNDDFELLIEDPFNQPNRKINRLNDEIKALKEESSQSKIATYYSRIYFSSTLFHNDVVNLSQQKNKK